MWYWWAAYPFEDPRNFHKTIYVSLYFSTFWQFEESYCSLHHLLWLFIIMKFNLLFYLDGGLGVPSIPYPTRYVSADCRHKLFSDLNFLLIPQKGLLSRDQAASLVCKNTCKKSLLKLRKQTIRKQNATNQLSRVLRK